MRTFLAITGIVAAADLIGAAAWIMRLLQKAAR